MTSPVEVLLALAGRMDHAVNVLGAMVTTDGLNGPAADGLLRMITQLRLALEALQRLNLEERHIELEASRAKLVVEAVRAAIKAVPELLPDQRTRMISAFLVGIGQGSEDPPASVQVVRGELG